MRRSTFPELFEHEELSHWSAPMRRNTVIHLNPDEKSRWSPIEHFADFCGFTTIHGLADWARSWVEGVTWVRFSFWTCAFLSAFFAAVYGCYAIVDDYMAQPVVISYMVQDAPQKFLPDAVICPFSRFNASFFERNNISLPLVEYIQSVFRMRKLYQFQYEDRSGWTAQPNAFSNSTRFAKHATAQSISAEQNAQDLDELLLRLGNISFGQLIDMASFDCNALVPYCVNTTKLYNCCETSVPVLSMAGKCVRLKGSVQRNSGFGFGITIVIKVPEAKYLSPASNMLHNDGISLKLAEPGKGLDFDLTFIPNGVHALVPLRATKHEFMSSPGKYECFGQESSEGYSPLQCFDDCFFEKAMEACQCRMITASNLTYPACKPKQQANCIIPHTRKLYQADTKQFLQRCQEACRRPCYYWAYYPTVSYARFPSATLFDYVDGESGEDWSRYIILDIFYEKLEYTTIKHYDSMSAGTFIANLGGQLGLWVGGSILSVCQVFCLVCSILWNCAYHRLGGKRNLQRLLAASKIASQQAQLISNVARATIQDSTPARAMPAAPKLSISEHYGSNDEILKRDDLAAAANARDCHHRRAVSFAGELDSDTDEQSKSLFSNHETDSGISL